MLIVVTCVSLYFYQEKIENRKSDSKNEESA